jgi:hypothetical protein
VLGLGLAALVGWKFIGKSSADQAAATAATTPPPPAPPPTLSRIDDVPLPPDPEPEAPDAAVAPKAPTTAINPCEAKTCAGAMTPELENALAMRAKQAHRCYDQALATDSTLAGRVAINVRIASNGQICSASVAKNELSNPSVAQCMASTYRKGNFPAPKGGCADVEIPVSLKPGQ